METKERWVPIPGHPKYEISDHGGVRCVTGEPVRFTRQTGGKASVRIDGAQFSVHRLVLTTFVGPCPNGYMGCHRNDEPADNRLVNLYWGTDADNRRDATRNNERRKRDGIRIPGGFERYEEIIAALNVPFIECHLEMQGRAFYARLARALGVSIGAIFLTAKKFNIELPYKEREERMATWRNL